MVLFLEIKTGLIEQKYTALNSKTVDGLSIEELPFNGADYSTAHPALSSDGEKLYFASDMPGTLGLSDIFSVDLFMRMALLGSL